MSSHRGGLALAGRFYREAVAPLLDGVEHAAALLGAGSEVLGYDDEVSRDHDFGLRLQIFVADPSQVAPVLARLDALPESVQGWPVRFPGSFDPRPHHHVQVTMAAAYFTTEIGVDPEAGLPAVDWLLVPTQILSGLTRGAIFHDPAGELARRRTALAWYPDDVWRYVLAAAWLRISQEEPFVGRTGAAGDDLGSRNVAARVARDMMRLSFLINRVYAPYSKWFGRAFTELPLAPDITDGVRAAFTSDGWRAREAGLTTAGAALGRAVNALGLGPAVDPAPRQFHDRDIRTTPSEAFAVALTSEITDPGVRAILHHQGQRGALGRLTGSVDQFVDSTDVLSDIRRCRAMRPLLIGGA